MVDDRPEDIGPSPDVGRAKRPPPTIELEASEVSSEPRNAGGDTQPEHFSQEPSSPQPSSQERPAAASVTSAPKTFAWATGSIISGYLLTLSGFGWPLLIGGAIKAGYDILLLIKFRQIRPPEEQSRA